jgi:hypothetical protein
MTVNFGRLRNDLTHVTVLVHDPFGNGQFYVVDPTFSAYLVRREDGAWATLRDVLTMPPHNLEIRAGDMRGRDFLLHRAAYTPSRGAIDIRGRTFADCVQRGELVRCRRDTFGLQEYLEDSRPAFAAAGLPATEEGFVQLFRTEYFNYGYMGSPEAQQELGTLLRSRGLTQAAPG